MKKEIRHIRSDIKVDDVNGNTIYGYAAVFNSPSQDLGGFTEVILPGAFTESLKSDVLCLYNHDGDELLGRTQSGTLKLEEDEHGLKFSLTLPDTSKGRDVRELITRGDLSGCSFGFVIEDENWLKNGADTVCELHRVKLFEISVVVNPAYLATEVDLRRYEAFVETEKTVEIEAELPVKKTNLEHYRKIIVASV